MKLNIYFSDINASKSLVFPELSYPLQCMTKTAVDADSGDYYIGDIHKVVNGDNQNIKPMLETRLEHDEWEALYLACEKKLHEDIIK